MVEVPVLLTELLSPDQIKIPLVGTSKDAVLDELIDVVANRGEVQDAEEIRRAVRDREEVLSTGIGNGVAIPHGKSTGVDRLILTAGVTERPIDFEALDGQPVSLFFLLVGPDSAAGQHVKALSRISRLLRKESFRSRLCSAGSAEEFYQVLEEAEAS